MSEPTVEESIKAADLWTYPNAVHDQDHRITIKMLKVLRSSLKQAQDALAESENTLSIADAALDVERKMHEDSKSALASSENTVGSLTVQRKLFRDRFEKAESALEAMTKERDDYKAGAEVEAADRDSKCGRANKAEAERDQLAAAVEDLREAVGWIGLRDDEMIGIIDPVRGSQYWTRFPPEDSVHAPIVWFLERCWKARSLPTNYKSILEARDKRVRAEALKWAWNRVLFEGNIMLRGGLMGVECLRVIVQILRAEAEKGEKG